MAMSPELQAMYRDNHCKMADLKRQFRLFFWLIVALSAMWFGSSALIAARSTMDENIKGANKFFVAMSTGTMQIIFAIVTFILGSLTSQRKRLPSLIAIGIYGISLVLLLVRANITLSALSMGLLALSLGVHIWAQMLCNHDEELKEQPGYPLFSVEADTPAEYEISKVVTARAKQAGSEMATLGGKPAPKHQGPVLSAPAEKIDLSDMYANREPGQAPPKLGPISLKTQQVQAAPAVTAASLVPFQPEAPQPETAAPVPEPAEPAAEPAAALPVITDMLSDSGQGLSAGNRLYQPHEELLPDPAEVRRRLAEMKRAREQEK